MMKPLLILLILFMLGMIALSALALGWPLLFLALIPWKNFEVKGYWMAKNSRVLYLPSIQISSEVAPWWITVEFEIAWLKKWCAVCINYQRKEAAHV